MTSQTRLITAVAVGLVIVVAAGAWLMMRDSGTWLLMHSSGTWPSEARTAFIDNCVAKCRTSPGMTEDRYPLCDSACSCAADESEKFVSVADLEAMGQASQSSESMSSDLVEKMNRVKNAGTSCALKVAKGQK